MSIPLVGTAVAGTAGALAGALNGVAASTNPSVPGQAGMSFSDFMKILTGELSNQDPLQPVDNTQFVNQLAGMQTLQTMQQLSDTITGMGQSNRMVLAASFIGKEVTAVDAQGNPVTGVVSQVVMNNQTPQLVINGGAFDLSQILSISAAPASTTQPLTTTTP